MVLAALGYGEHVAEVEEETNGTRNVVTILVCFTDALSARLMKGQLGFLQNSGFVVHVGTAVTTKASQPSDSDWAQLVSSLDSGIVPHHIPFVREPSPWRDLRSLVSSISLIRRVRPDIMVVSTPKAGLIGMVAAWFCRVPVRVYTVRGFRFETMSGFRRRLFRMFERVIVRLSHHIVFNSMSLCRIAESEGIIRPGRGRIIGSGSGNGIDVRRFSPVHLPTRSSARTHWAIPLDAIVIGFVGRLTADKGVDDLVQVFTENLETEPRLESVRENLWLVVVGDREPGDPLDPRTSEFLADHPRIRHLGWIDHPESVYPMFDILAFPSYREGFPNVPLEAQLCGIPVVGYAATGTVDAVRDGETGLLVAVGNRRDLAHALVTLLTDPALRTRLTAEASTWVRNTFDQHQLWTELATSYRQWLNQA